MKQKSNSLIYTTIIIIYTVFGCTFLNNMYTLTRVKFQAFEFIIYMIIIAIPFGCFLGLENLINELKKEGKFKWDVYNIIVSFSLLLIMVNYLLGYSKLTNLFFYNNSAYSIMICSVLFGYMITRLFKKI